MKIKIKSTENEVKAAIKKYLEVCGYTMYRINNGGVAIGGRSGKAGDKARFVFHGTKGFPDLVAIKPQHNVIFVETKATGKIPSHEQTDFLAVALTCPGVIALWADSLDMFMVKLNENPHFKRGGK